MDSVLASSLSGCNVMTTDGAELGTVENVTMDPSTGALEHLRLDPNDRATSGFDRAEDGQLLVPAHRVEAKKDYLLVSPPRQ